MTTWIATMFHQGGAAMYSIVFLLWPSFALGLLHAVRPRRWSFYVATGLAALVLAIGVLAWRDNRSTIDSYLEREANDPESRVTAREREAMREDGYLEAIRPLQFGSAVTGLCAVPILIGELRRRRRRA